MIKTTLKHKPLLLLLAVLFAVITSFAQNECTIKNFNAENGLPQNEITAMTMDYDGYLWLGTRSGLVRYDGTGFRTFVFDKKVKNEWSNTVLYLMNFPAEKKVVMKTRDGSSYLIKNGIPVLHYDTSDINYNNQVNGRFPSLALFGKLQFSVFNINNGEDWASPLREMQPVNEKDFIMGSSGYYNIIYFKNGEKQWVKRLENRLEKYLASQGRQFIFDRQRLMYLFDKPTGEIYKVDIDWGIFKSAAKAMNQMRFFSDPVSGESFSFLDSTFYMLRFSPSENLMRFIPQFIVPGQTHTWSDIVYDSLNSVYFVSTQNEGFFQFKQKKIKTYKLIGQTPGEVDPVQAINYSTLKKNESTVVTTGGFQLKVNPSGITVNKLGNIFGESSTICLLKDSSILCTENSGLYYYSPQDGYKTRHEFNKEFNARAKPGQVKMLYAEGDSVWVSSIFRLCCITKNKITTIENWWQNDKLIHLSLCLFYRYNKEEAFIANAAGFYRFKTTYPYKFTDIPEMKGKQVRYIIPYNGIYILTVYKDGLYVWKDNRFYKVPMGSDSTGLSTCHSAYIDKNDFLWVPTDKGLYKSTPASVVASALNQTSPPFFFYYGKDDGIENIEFNGRGVPSYTVLNEQQIFYPSMGGIVSFKLTETNDRITASPIFIEKVLVDNKKNQQSTDSIYLKPDFKYLTIQISTANFSDPQNLILEYALDSSEWQTVLQKDNLQITLVDISHGTHKLTIRKRTGFGNNDYVYTSLYIFKEKFIYQKWWFYPALLALLVFIIWFYSRLKTKSINKKRIQLQKKVDEQTSELSKAGEVKDLLISIISHDMIAPLRHVSFIAEILEKGVEKDPQRAKEALGDIKSTSARIMNGSLSIINWMKYNNKQIQLDKKLLNVYNLVDEIIEIYIPIANSKNILLQNIIPRELYLELDYNIFSTIIGNLVSNAIKYTSTGDVTISAEQEINGTTIIKIKDTGPGIKPEVLKIINEVLKGNLQAFKTSSKISTGLGYILISELEKVHNFSIKIDSLPNAGTTVSIAINEPITSS